MDGAFAIEVVGTFLRRCCLWFFDVQHRSQVCHFGHGDEQAVTEGFEIATFTATVAGADQLRILADLRIYPVVDFGYFSDDSSDFLWFSHHFSLFLIFSISLNS